jgi:hypothetical protein
VESPSVFLLSEFVAAALGAFLDVAMAAIFIYAYTRCSRFFFIVLCVGALAFAFTSSYAALLTYSALVHADVFSVSVARFLVRVYILVVPVASLVSFVGTVLLVRFTLKLYRAEGT